jgi:hypothetical protein
VNLLLPKLATPVTCCVTIEGEKMRKYMMLYYGYEKPTPEIMDNWNKWFASLGDKLVEPGSPFRSGREITLNGSVDLPLNMEAITGYCIISAENMDEAERLAQGCPIIASVRVYETASM